MKTLDEIIKERSKVTKTNICYLDDEGNVVTKEKAVKCIITEYDSQGNVINEIFGEIEKEGDER